jgi:hypothetical protein
MDVEPQDEGMFVDLLFKNPVGWLMISSSFHRDVN